MKHGIWFKYDGVPFDEIDYKSSTEGETTTYTLPDGLLVKVVENHFPEYGITKWTNYWENPTDHDSGVITELCDCSIEIPFEADPPITRRNRFEIWEPENLVELYETLGANVTQEDHWLCNFHLWPGWHYDGSNTNGHEGKHLAPFYEASKYGKGILFAIGWTGLWFTSMDRTEEVLKIKAGVANVSISMKPHEKFRTSSITVLEFSEGREKAHNEWRRYIREVVSPFAKSKGRRGTQSPFSAIFWGGIPTENLIDRLDHIVKAGLPFDTCWIDAGWYEPLRATTMNEQMATWANVGTWEVNKFYHPDGYKDVIKFLKEHNMDFMVWHEPERIRPAVATYTKYIKSDNPDCNDFLVALHEDSVCDEVIEKISKSIEELNLKVYRQDCNISANKFWQMEDARQENGNERRRGATEIHYVNNLWRFWDTLLERFPDLLIDNCAGGGHRIDMEMMERSIPLWRSDYQCKWDTSPEANQNMNAMASYWYPYSGIGFGPTLGDTYAFRSYWSNGLTVRTWEHVDPEWEFGGMNEPVDWAKKNFTQFRDLRHYFAEDFYSLIAPTKTNITWFASQYHDRKDDSGLILAFRRARSPFDRATVALKGLSPDNNYIFTNEDTGETFAIKGSEAENFIMNIPNMRESLLLTYKKA